MDIITMNFALVLAMLMLVIASGNIGVLVVYYGGNNNDGEEHVKSYKDLYKNIRVFTAIMVVLYFITYIAYRLIEW